MKTFTIKEYKSENGLRVQIETNHERETKEVSIFDTEHQLLYMGDIEEAEDMFSAFEEAIKELKIK